MSRYLGLLACLLIAPSAGSARAEAPRAALAQMRAAAYEQAEVDPEPRPVLRQGVLLPRVRSQSDADEAKNSLRNAVRAAVRGEVERELTPSGNGAGSVNGARARGAGLGQDKADKADKAEKDQGNSEEAHAAKEARIAAMAAQEARRNSDVAKQNGKERNPNSGKPGKP